jgi:hypothetical protein
MEQFSKSSSFKIIAIPQLKASHVGYKFGASFGHLLNANARSELKSEIKKVVLGDIETQNGKQSHMNQRFGFK